MDVPEEFRELIEFAENRHEYIGMGNPNARTLIIGREPSDVAGYAQDQGLNLKNWKKILEGKPYEGRCNPCHPFPDQKCVRNNGKNGGTSATWVWYQKLVDRILGREDDRPYPLRPVDFHDFCFHTDISAEPAKGAKEVNEAAKKKSVYARSEELFNKSFFRQFPIVILAVGSDVGPNSYLPLDWCKKYLYLPINEDKSYIDEKGKKRFLWVNQSADHRRILVHTYCLSQRISNEYIDRISDLIHAHIPPNSCWPKAY